MKKKRKPENELPLNELPLNEAPGYAKPGYPPDEDIFLSGMKSFCS